MAERNHASADDCRGRDPPLPAISREVADIRIVGCGQQFGATLGMGRAWLLRQGPKPHRLRPSIGCARRAPTTSAELRKLPGVGAYTSAAIAAIAFGEAAPAVDTNVERVIARLYAQPRPVRSDIEQHVVKMMQGHRPGGRRPGADGSWRHDLPPAPTFVPRLSARAALRGGSQRIARSLPRAASAQGSTAPLRRLAGGPSGADMYG